MSAAVSAAELVADATWYPLRIEYQTRDIVFGAMDRGTYVASSFLDHRTITADNRGLKLPLSALEPVLESMPLRPMNMIFHTAFCGSTLLSRCLDVEGRSLALREPFLLHQLSLIKRGLPCHYGVAGMLAADAAPLGLVHKLLGRTFAELEKPLVKPSDTCINIAPELLQLVPGSRAILLYSDLESFILAMLRREDRREFLRGMMSRAMIDLQGYPGIGPGLPSRLKDGEKAGLLWLSLMHKYQAILADDSLEVRSLQDKALYADPGAVVARCARYFELDVPAEAIAGQVDREFNRDAKGGAEPYSQQKRADRRQRQLKSFGREIQLGIDWVSAHAGAAPVPAQLPRAL